MAILILTMTIGALLTLAAGGFFSARYARNQIVASSLMQESLEYIRNSRDNAVLQGLTWDQWRGQFDVDTNGNSTAGSGCFAASKCFVDPYTTGPNVKACTAGNSCPAITYYPDAYFYGYQSNAYPFTITQQYLTSFVRSVTMTNGIVGTDQVVVTVSVTWLNGTSSKTVSQSTLLTRWTP